MQESRKNWFAENQFNIYVGVILILLGVGISTVYYFWGFSAQQKQKDARVFGIEDSTNQDNLKPEQTTEESRSEALIVNHFPDHIAVPKNTNASNSQEIATVKKEEIKKDATPKKEPSWE